MERTFKNNHPFPPFFKKNEISKNHYFPTDRNFGHQFLKISRKSSMFLAPALKIFLDKLWIKQLQLTKNFSRKPRIRHCKPYFHKKHLGISCFSDFWFILPWKLLENIISAVFCPETSNFFHFLPKICKRRFQNYSLSCRLRDPRPTFCPRRIRFYEANMKNTGAKKEWKFLSFA